MLGNQNQFGTIFPAFDLIRCEDNVVGWIDEVRGCVGLDPGNDQQPGMNTLVV